MHPRSVQTDLKQTDGNEEPGGFAGVMRPGLDSSGKCVSGAARAAPPQGTPRRRDTRARAAHVARWPAG